MQIFLLLIYKKSCILRVNVRVGDECYYVYNKDVNCNFNDFLLMEVSGNKINTQIPIKFLFEIVIIFEYAGIVKGCSIKAYEVPADGSLKKIYGWLA
jgi:hypothetical protein